MQQILADQKSLDLRGLLESARATGDGITNRDVIRYRREAELNVGSDDHLYRVEWVSYFCHQYTADVINIFDRMM